MESMEQLPEDILIKIYEMKHQMEFNDVLNQVKYFKPMFNYWRVFEYDIREIRLIQAVFQSTAQYIEEIDFVYMDEVSIEQFERWWR